MSKVIFKDPELQAQFETLGYVQIQLLEPKDISELLEMFHGYFPEPAEGFFSSSYLNDYALKKEMSDRIVSVFQRRLANYFIDYRVFGAAFLSKTAGKRSEMPMHQDWSLVDESKYVAVNIWTPLQDANKVNGSLEILPGSHSFAPVRRSPTIEFFWKGYEGEMQKSLVPLEVKAGEAVVLNQAVVHYSPANQTEDARVAITTGLLSAEAQMEFYYQAESGKLEIIQMEDDFLLQWVNFHEAIFKRPKFGESLGFTHYQHPDYSKEKMMSFFKSKKAEKELESSEKRNLFGWILKIFG